MLRHPTESTYEIRRGVREKSLAIITVRQIRAKTIKLQIKQRTHIKNGEWGEATMIYERTKAHKTRVVFFLLCQSNFFLP